MPDEGMEWLPRSQVLTFEEIETVARVAVQHFGIRSIRLTGGEPTLRANVAGLISQLAALSTPDHPIDLAMTTNGSTLASLAETLRAAGLNRVNISLDSLDPDRFARLTRRDDLARVLEGIDAACAAGFDAVKVNCVVMAGCNEDELVDFAVFGRERGIEVRFIEFMPLDADGAWTRSSVVSLDQIVSTIGAAFPLETLERGSAPAAKFRYLDGRGTFGVIASVTDAFCGSCDRVRLSAEGGLRNCLFAQDEVDLRGILRGSVATPATGDLVEDISGDKAGDTSVDTERMAEELVAAIQSCVAAKALGHGINEPQFIRPRKSMSQIGG
jgi:cyclic pyranopterin phosphate synthase